MRILLGCERSGKIRDAFRELGHDAVSCDWFESDTPGPHIKGNVLDVLGEGWDAAIFHPDCTYLSVSQAWTFSPRFKHRFPDREYKRALAIEFAERLWLAPIPRIAIENPVGFLSTMSKLGPSTQSIQPYDFGDDASKRTCLWLKGFPKLAKTKYVQPRYVNGKPRWANQTDSGQNRLGPSESRAYDRAKTYPGIAAAMADQWGTLK